MVLRRVEGVFDADGVTSMRSSEERRRSSQTELWRWCSSRWNQAWDSLFLEDQVVRRSTPNKRWRMSRKVGLSANTSQFTLEGEAFHILGGSIHYFRVPRAYWRDRLMKMKACGINTLTTHVPWSLHQPEREVFNFHTQLDLEAYINLAAELGLWVILCPGPYISAELDLGGLPSWLLRDGSMRLRTTHHGFTQAVNIYFDKLIPKMVPLQFKKGGP
ncbi:beta-galactosidase-1-like protein 2, partial [Austrofundulus limnaeus]|uniref:Beta-galactosidase-1-like protein 2 n=1 Tax=Austrofundulus limnaeus TaxID=52670 RepID=A0A2I4AKT9_AUSLI